MPRSCARGFAGLPYWNGMNSVGSASASSRARVTAPFEPSSAGRVDHVGAEQPHELLALGRRPGRHHDRDLEAAQPALHRERDAGVAARGLEDAPAGPELAGLGGGVEHRAGHAVLDRARRVEPLELREQADVRAGREPRQLDERRAADRPAELHGRGAAASSAQLPLPPAIAGRTITLASAASGVSSPPLTRTSSPST